MEDLLENKLQIKWDNGQATYSKIILAVRRFVAYITSINDKNKNEKTSKFYKDTICQYILPLASSKQPVNTA